MKELTELLRIAMAKDTKQTASVRELTNCVRAQREKLLDKDEVCEQLRTREDKLSTDLRASEHHASQLAEQLAAKQANAENTSRKLVKTVAESQQLQADINPRMEEMRNEVQSKAQASVDSAMDQVRKMQEAAKAAEVELLAKQSRIEDQAAQLQTAKQV